MKERQQTITVTVPEGSWVTFNDSQTGLYRTHYPSAYLNKLAVAIESLIPVAQVIYTASIHFGVLLIIG